MPITRWASVVYAAYVDADYRGLPLTFDAAVRQALRRGPAAFAVGLPGFSVYLYSLRAFYSMQDTRTPFFLNCFENGANIVGALLLYPLLGIPGLALAFAGAYTISAVIALVAVSRRLGGLRGRQIGSTFARVLAVGAAVGATTWLIADRIGSATPARAVLAVAVGGAAGIAVAIAGLWLLRVHELRELRDAFRPATRDLTVSP
jgi:putative peptidoglycan lipid II flippase